MPKITSVKEILKGNRNLQKKVGSINPKRLKTDDIPHLKSINDEVTAFLGSDTEKKKVWADHYNLLLQIARYGVEDKGKTIAAMFLVGAAITEDYPIHVSFHSSLHAARQKRIDNSRLEPFEVRCVNAYKKLRLKKRGRIFTRLRSLISDPLVPLRLGRQMQKLDISKIEKAYKMHVASPTHLARHQINTDGPKVKRYELTAPTKLNIELTRFKCENKNESTSDEIKWLTFTTQLENLVEIYNHIDAWISSRCTIPLLITPKLTTHNTISNLTGGIHENQEKPLHLALPTISIHNGFAPWSASIVCLEDDSQEYEGINEVVDTIGDVAGAVSDIAGTVALVGGVSVVGAAAGVVSLAAEIVSITGSVVSAIVDIINFFDDDDCVGETILTGSGDYASQPEGTLPEEMRSLGGMNEGQYTIWFERKFSGTATFQRNWTYETKIHQGDKVHRNPTGFWGGAGEDDVIIIFDDSATYIDEADVAGYTRDRNRHAEWQSPPVMKSGASNNSGYIMKYKYASGTVHWGVRSTHSITYQPWVKVVYIKGFL